MVSNTKQRIVSAVVIVAGVALAVFIGRWATLLCALLIALLCMDELLTKFVQVRRANFFYRSGLFAFSALFIATNALGTTEVFGSKWSLVFFSGLAFCMNIFLVYYLFKIPLEKSFIRKNAEKMPMLITLLVALPFLSFGIFFENNYWKETLAIILVLTSSMDTGAWFIGKNFGKHKLWPSVSPKKTMEGFIGGTFFAAVCGSFAWHYFFGKYHWYYSGIFALCGVISQLGDLVQSKIKREFKIKDSSNLIPGHGGVYDRIDSLIFLSPFFVIVVKYLG